MRRLINKRDGGREKKNGACLIHVNPLNPAEMGFNTSSLPDASDCYLLSYQSTKKIALWAVVLRTTKEGAERLKGP